jgi:hypothetical protein
MSTLGVDTSWPSGKKVVCRRSTPLADWAADLLVDILYACVYVHIHI